MSGRVTRSRSRQPSHGTTPPPVVDGSSVLRTRYPAPKCRFLSDGDLLKRLARLPNNDLELLRSKQRRLQEYGSRTQSMLAQYKAEDDPSPLIQATASTLVFAWEAAGTAVCISPDGLLLTCSHCIAETEDEYNQDKLRWLLFASGDTVQAKCIAWDSRRDLALLQITAAPSSCPTFPHIDIAPKPPRRNAQMLCIGHPGSEDLEASQAGVATDYDVLHVSEGRFRGLAKGQDPQDNSEIGALMHDCWTYWGHSGAPIVGRDTGLLVGLHSSWDDETGMRRGVAWEALTAFLDEHTIR